jgi:hypothetical protein
VVGYPEPESLSTVPQSDLNDNVLFDNLILFLGIKICCLDYDGKPQYQWPLACFDGHDLPRPQRWV